MKFASTTVVLTAGLMAVVLTDGAYTDTLIDICSKSEIGCHWAGNKNLHAKCNDDMDHFKLDVTEADNFTSVVFSSRIYLKNGTYGANNSTPVHISSNISAFGSSLPESLSSLDSDMIRQEQMLSRSVSCLSNGYYSADRLINITRELRKMMNTVKCNLANNNAFNVTGNVTTTNYFCAKKEKDNFTGELTFRSEFKIWTHLVINSPSESAEHIDSDIQELLKRMSHIRQCQFTDTSYGPYSWFTDTVSNCCDGWKPDTHTTSDSGFTMIAISVVVVVASIVAVIIGVLKLAKSKSNQSIRSSARLPNEGLVQLQEGNGGLYQGDLPFDGSAETKSKTQKLMRVMRLVFEDGTTSGGKTHDLFLHYHDDDIEWVEEFLIPFLVETLEMKVTHKEDFLPGSITMEEQIKCLSSCEFIVLVLSNSFVKDPNCRDVTIRAYSTSPHRIVPLGFKLTCELDSDPVFMGLVRTNGLIKWPEDDQKRPNFWSQLRKHFTSLNERPNNLEEKVQLIKNCLTPKNSNEVSAKANKTDDRTIEAFVYFHDDDSNWTKSYLIPKLENKLKMIVKTVDDIPPGSITLVENLKSLNQTDLFVFVISDSFIGEQECREFLARTYSLRRHEILQVVLDLPQRNGMTDHYGVVLNMVKSTNQIQYSKPREHDFLESVKVRSKTIICNVRGRNGYIH